MDPTTLQLLERIAVALENLVALKVIDATLAVNGATPGLGLKLPALAVPTRMPGDGALGSVPVPTFAAAQPTTAPPSTPAGP
jgi:hypothetical protein